MQGFVPVMMGEKIIGAIKVDLNTGEFNGRFDQESVDILRYGMTEEGLKAVTVQSFFGMAAHQDMSAQDRFKAYLKGEPQTQTNTPTVVTFNSDEAPTKFVVAQHIGGHETAQVERTVWSDGTVGYRHREKIRNGSQAGAWSEWAEGQGNS